MLSRLPCDTLGAETAKAPARKSRAPWALAAAVLGSTLASLDATGVNVSLPTLQREFSASPADVQWVIEGYSLFLSALILTGGALGDRYGRRLIFSTGVFLFGVTSLACGLAPSLGFLNVARCVQGVGAALMVPGSLALIAAAFDERTRGAAIGTWAGVSALSSAIGPPLGGWLTQAVSWRWIFLINVPLAAAIVAIALLRVDESSDGEAARRFDVLGALLATLGLGGLTYGFVELQAPRANHPLDIGAMVLGFALLGAFARQQMTAREPMIPRELLHNRVFVTANIYTFVLYAALGGAMYFLPFELQLVRGYSPLASGAALLPFVAVMTVASRFTGALFPPQRAPLALTLGPVFVALGFFCFAFSGTHASYWVSYFPGALLLGAGAAMFVAPLTTLVMNAAAAHAGAGSGVNNAISRAGALLAVAVLGTLVYVGFSSAIRASIAQPAFAPATRAAVERDFARATALEIPPGVPAKDRAPLKDALRTDYASAFRLAMIACAIVCLLSSLYARFAIRSAAANRAGARLANAT